MGVQQFEAESPSRGRFVTSVAVDAQGQPTSVPSGVHILQRVGEAPGEASYIGVIGVGGGRVAAFASSEGQQAWRGAAKAYVERVGAPRAPEREAAITGVERFDERDPGRVTGVERIVAGVKKAVTVRAGVDVYGKRKPAPQPDAQEVVAVAPPPVAQTQRETAERYAAQVSAAGSPAMAKALSERFGTGELAQAGVVGDVKRMKTRVRQVPIQLGIRPAEEAIVEAPKGIQAKVNGVEGFYDPATSVFTTKTGVSYSVSPEKVTAKGAYIGGILTGSPLLAARKVREVEREVAVVERAGESFTSRVGTYEKRKAAFAESVDVYTREVKAYAAEAAKYPGGAPPVAYGRLSEKYNRLMEKKQRLDEAEGVLSAHQKSLLTERSHLASESERLATTSLAAASYVRGVSKRITPIQVTGKRPVIPGETVLKQVPVEYAPYGGKPFTGEQALKARPEVMAAAISERVKEKGLPAFVDPATLRAGGALFLAGATAAIAAPFFIGKTAVEKGPVEAVKEVGTGFLGVGAAAVKYPQAAPFLLGGLAAGGVVVGGAFKGVRKVSPVSYEAVKIPVAKGKAKTIYRGFYVEKAGVPKYTLGLAEGFKVKTALPKPAEVPSLKLLELPEHAIAHVETYPKGKLATAIVASPEALKYAGFRAGEAAKVKLFLEGGRLYEKQVSAFVEKEFPVKTRRLTEPAIKETVKYAQEAYKKRELQEIYGSYSAAAQVPTKYRRLAADIEMQMTSKEAASRGAKALTKRYQRIGVKAKAVETDGHIAVEVEGKKAVEFKYPGEPQDIEGQVLGKPGLRYGFAEKQPPIEIKGVAAQRLSEQLIRKGSAATQWWKKGRRKIIEPALHRPKDVPDFYFGFKTLVESGKKLKTRTPAETARGLQIAKEWRALEWKTPGIERLYKEIELGKQPVQFKIPLEAKKAKGFPSLVSAPPTQAPPSLAPSKKVSKPLFKPSALPSVSLPSAKSIVSLPSKPSKPSMVSVPSRVSVPKPSMPPIPPASPASFVRSLGVSKPSRAPKPPSVTLVSAPAKPSVPSAPTPPKPSFPSIRKPKPPSPPSPPSFPPYYPYPSPTTTPPPPPPPAFGATWPGVGWTGREKKKKEKKKKVKTGLIPIPSLGLVAKYESIFKRRLWMPRITKPEQKRFYEKTVTGALYFPKKIPKSPMPARFKRLGRGFSVPTPKGAEGVLAKFRKAKKSVREPLLGFGGKGGLEGIATFKAAFGTKKKKKLGGF